MTQITKRHLDFVQEAKEAFEGNPDGYTYRNGDDDSLIALRYGADRDCVLVYELGEKIANFVQQMDPCPVPRKPVMEFAHDMEKQLKANDHKGGWMQEHWCDLVTGLEISLEKLKKELMKMPKHNEYEVTTRCANIANFAMMIADNRGKHL